MAALRTMTYASVWRNAKQDQPGPEGPMLKLFYAELAQRVYQLAMIEKEERGLAPASTIRSTTRYLGRRCAQSPPPGLAHGRTSRRSNGRCPGSPRHQGHLALQAHG